MGIVIGPTWLSARARFADWLTMREIRADIGYYYSKPDVSKYKVAVDKQTELYKRFLSDYSVRSAANDNNEVIDKAA